MCQSSFAAGATLRNAIHILSHPPHRLGKVGFFFCLFFGLLALRSAGKRRIYKNRNKTTKVMFLGGTS